MMRTIGGSYKESMYLTDPIDKLYYHDAGPPVLFGQIRSSYPSYRNSQEAKAHKLYQ